MIRLAILLALLPSLAGAQTPACLPHDAMVRHLAEGWGEVRQGLGLERGGAVVELFASPDTGTWTMTLTRPGAPTCMVASGHAWELVAEAPPVLDEPA